MRKASIELARVIACLFVIGVHVALPSVVNDTYDASRVLNACFVADGVAIFWLISGFFIFNTRSYSKLVKRTIKNIVVPMMIYLIFAFYFSGWLIEGKTLQESFVHTGEEYFDLLKGLLSWNVTVSCSGHLWYLMIYFIVILMYPVLKAFVDYLNEDYKRQKNFMLISGALLLYNDLSSNRMAEFAHHSFNGAIPAAILLIWGNIIYQHKDEVIKRKNAIWYGIIFVLVNFLRMFIIIKRQGHEYDYGNILYWYSLIGLLCAMMVCFFCMAVIDDKSERGMVIKKGICWLSSYTFNIYIIHQMLIIFFDRKRVQERLFCAVTSRISGWIGEYVYIGIMIGIVFITALVILVVLKAIKDGIKMVTKKAGKSI